MFINASIPNPGPDGPSMNFWNSSVDIPSFNSPIQYINLSFVIALGDKL